MKKFTFVIILFDAKPDSYLKKVASPLAGRKRSPANHQASSSPDLGGPHG
jgi:hypothetical protein